MHFCSPLGYVFTLLELRVTKINNNKPVFQTLDTRKKELMKPLNIGPNILSLISDVEEVYF